MGRIITVELHHYATFHGDWSNCYRDISILDFSRWWQPQSWIFKILHFNNQNGQEGRTASLCQILSKSLKARRYVSFRFFKMAGAAILDFWNFKFLTVGTVKRIKLHLRAKFRWNRPNRGRDIAIYRFFKMAAAAILDFKNFKFLTVGTVKRVEVLYRAKFRPNRSNHGWNMAIFRFFKMAAAAILDFRNFKFFNGGGG